MLSKREKNIIIEAFKRYKPNKLGVFGSHSRGTASPQSDIDILYDLDETIGLFKLIGVKQTLEEQLNRPVDLVAEKYIHKLLRPHLTRDLVLLYNSFAK